jgi:hypothetical protein
MFNFHAVDHLKTACRLMVYRIFINMRILYE